MDLTSRIGSAPEHNWPILVLFRAEDLMEVDGKSVEVANVKWAKVVVEGVVQKAVIYRKVERSFLA